MMVQRFGAINQQRVPPALYEEPHWYACHTRARHEKRVGKLLVQRGLESYLPMLVKERKWSDRSKLIEFPLFPGYVFTRFTLFAGPLGPGNGFVWSGARSMGWRGSSWSGEAGAGYWSVWRRSVRAWRLTWTVGCSSLPDWRPDAGFID